jgi:uncharacterized protein
LVASCLLEHLTRLVASCLLGVIWAVWHRPLFWTQGATLAGSSPLVLVLELPAVSIVYTWVFEHTNGSVLIAILLHAGSNLCTVSASVGGAASWQLITVLLVSKWLVAGAVVLAWVRQLRRPVAPD